MRLLSLSALIGSHKHVILSEVSYERSRRIGWNEDNVLRANTDPSTVRPPLVTHYGRFAQDDVIASPTRDETISGQTNEISFATLSIGSNLAISQQDIHP
jgi:hypothetical protein